MLAEERPIDIDAKPKRQELDWQALRARSVEAGGFGGDRVDIWPQLLNVSVQKAIKITDDNKLDPSTFEFPPHQDERQIGLDTDRSFVLYPVDTKYDREALQASLHELLVSLFRKRPQLSYFQGYHDIITVLLLTLPSEVQLACVEKISLHRLRDSMGTGLEPVLGLLRVTKNLLQLADPEYANILEQSSPLPFYALSNILTLFSHDMPTLPLIQHVFDYLLCRPPIAAVYLATAIILSRKEEAIRLEEEGEEGMIHSLLSSLPNLADGVLEMEKVEEEQFSWENDEALSHVDNTFFKEEEIEADALETPTHAVESLSALPEIKAEQDESLEQNLAELNVLSDNRLVSPPPTNDHEYFPESLGPDAPGHIDSPSKHNSEYTPAEDVDRASRSSVENPEIPAAVEASISMSIANPVKVEKDEEDDDNSPPHPTHAKPRQQLVLTDLLKHADTLYDAFPPSHSGLSLSSIMGPQSVVFTWSESSSALPSDNTAEAMVLHPELVVYPYVEPIDLDQKEGESDKMGWGKERRGKAAHRKRRKLRKSPFGQMEKKTMLAGTVLVLGVAMAIYGMNVRNGGGGSHGLMHNLADAHAHASAKDWKRLGGWVGAAFVGMSTKIMNGLALGS